MTKTTKYEELQELAREFWLWRANHQPLSSDDIPRIERPPGWVPDWSRQTIATRREDIARFEQQWRDIEASGWAIAQQVDYRLMGSALARVRWELDVTRSHEVNPDFYINQTLGSVYLLLLKPPPFDSTRTADLVTRMRYIPRTVEEAKTNLEKNCVRPFASAAMEKLEGVGSRIEKVVVALKPFIDDEIAAQLKSAAADAAAALAEFHDWLSARLPQMQTETAVGRDAYVFFLKQVALMPFTPEQLISLSAQEWERSVAFETFEQVRNADLPELSLFPDQASQMKREEELEHEVREFLEARKDRKNVV